MIIKPFIMIFTVISINHYPVGPWTLDSFPNTFTKNTCIKEMAIVKEYLHERNAGTLDIKCVPYKNLK